MAELQTHFELVSTMTALSEEMAACMQKHYENATGQRFEVREVAE